MKQWSNLCCSETSPQYLRKILNFLVLESKYIDVKVGKSSPPFPGSEITFQAVATCRTCGTCGSCGTCGTCGLCGACGTCVGNS